MNIEGLRDQLISIFQPPKGVSNVTDYSGVPMSFLISNRNCTWFSKTSDFPSDNIIPGVSQLAKKFP